jgi:hypothetical protein
MPNKKLPLADRVLSIEGWLNDNGAWGGKTKLAKLWDWYMSWKDKTKKLEDIDNKINYTECDLRHEKLIKDIENMLEKKDKNWRWWIEQMKWMLPMMLAILMWLSGKGFI